ncbi:MAG: DUF29 family protein [Xenococcaceae cyanobacterium]
MTQELIDLRISILEGRYDDALVIIDELEGMSKQATLRTVESFLVRLLVHLIKNQIEQRLTNSWIASISDSIVQISKLNIKDNKTSYYINSDQWYPYLEEAMERAIRPASVEVLNGNLKPKQVSERIDRNQIIEIAQKLLDLTYNFPTKDLPTAIDSHLVALPGGEDWFETED